MTKPPQPIDEAAKKPDIKLVRALQADFKALYQPQFTADYKTKQMLVNIELGIMRLDNLEIYIQKAVTAALKQVDEVLEDKKRHAHRGSRPQFSKDTETPGEYRARGRGFTSGMIVAHQAITNELSKFQEAE